VSISNRQHLAALDEHRAIIRRQESEIYALRDLLRSPAPKHVHVSTSWDGYWDRCKTCGQRFIP